MKGHRKRIPVDATPVGIVFAEFSSALHSERGDQDARVRLVEKLKVSVGRARP